MLKILHLFFSKEKICYCRFFKIRGQVYKLEISPYESVEELIERAANAGIFTAPENH